MKERFVLDVGCGTDRSYPFRPHVTVGKHPIFMDIEVPSKELRKWDWVVGDAHYLPFRGNIFEEVVASHVIEHLDDPIMFLKEVRRILKIGGRLHLFCPNFLSVNARADPSHKHVFNPIVLALVLKKLGFKVHFNYRAGSKLPNLIRKPLTVLLNMVSDEVSITATKWGG